MDGFLFNLALPTNPVNQIEEQEGNEGEHQNEQERIDVPHIRHDHVAELGNRRDGGEHELVGKTVNYCANKKTEETGDDIVELAFAATGGACTRSVTGEGHADPKDQPADDVTDDIRGRYSREDNQPQAAQSVQADH